MRCKKLANAIKPFVCTTIVSINSTGLVRVMMNDRICKDEAIDGISHTLQVTHQITTLRKGIGEVRKALRNI
jgi:hypothetical protein